MRAFYSLWAFFGNFCPKIQAKDLASEATILLEFQKFSNLAHKILCIMKGWEMKILNSREKIRLIKEMLVVDPVIERPKFKYSLRNTAGASMVASLKPGSMLEPLLDETFSGEDLDTT